MTFPHTGPGGVRTSLKIPQPFILTLREMDERARAIEELYRDRYVGFRNALATVTGSHESARDAVQEGFARALASRRQFRGDGSLAAWVWKITFRAALEARGENQGAAIEVVDPQLVEPERNPALTAALANLPPRRRLVVFLRYFADFSYAEIATACDVSEGTVAATLAQAHQALAASLSHEGAMP
jgi:RNA polymerase sigma factor (sigma-70 family)